MNEQEELKKYIYGILLQVNQATPIFKTPSNTSVKCRMCVQPTTRYYAYHKQDLTHKVIQNLAELQDVKDHYPIGVCCVNEKHQEKMRKMIEKVNTEIRIQTTERKIKDHRQQAQDLEKTLESEQQNLKRIKLDLGMDNLTL